MSTHFSRTESKNLTKGGQDAIEIQTLKRKNKEADHRIINHTYLASHQQSQNVYLLMILMF